MAHKGVLSSKFNMSLGFIPVIVSILLYEIITKDISIYIGTGVGILYSVYTFLGKGKYIPHFILYTTTIMLIIMTLATLILGSCCPNSYFPITLEVCAIIPTSIFYLRKKNVIGEQERQPRCCMDELSPGTISAIVSIRVVLIIAIIHFIAITIVLIFFRPLSTLTQNILFRVCPPIVFLVSILFNQYGIRFFNKAMEHSAFVPVVNIKGDVLGRRLASDVPKERGAYIHPIIRIAISYKSMLYLQPRSEYCIVETGKTDIPMECYLLYGESLENGVNRLINKTLPASCIKDIKFNIMYHFENEETNRLIYLFLLELNDDNILLGKKIGDGKLWTLRQIEHNLGKNFFSKSFEHEYEHLSKVIDTREKYKEF
ncbi:hypothetical protein FQ707_03190 [Bacteroidaceae bacterium HV4-6-C5C]|jgi:hypothetical protein|nr:hypothetical protein FQ707_03190 [Bacteroidaceae bacterium HV4-6-C5C]